MDELTADHYLNAGLLIEDIRLLLILKNNKREVKKDGMEY